MIALKPEPVNTSHPELEMSKAIGMTGENVITVSRQAQNL
jgi:hypothetical protein